MPKTNKLLILLASVSFVVVILCIVVVPLANFSQTQPQTSKELTDKTWYLQLIGEKPVGTQAFIKFLSDGKVAGSTGCNNFSGEYETSSNNLSFTPLATTKKACVDYQSQETQFLNSISEVKSYKIVGESLMLSGSQSALTFTSNVNLSSGIIGKWVLVKDGYGEVERTIATEIKANIEFSIDGRVGGQACNSFGGTYVLGDIDTSIEFSSINSTLMYCTDPQGLMDVESMILGALEDAKYYSIYYQESTLRIYFGDDSYLEFVKE